MLREHVGRCQRTPNGRAALMGLHSSWTKWNMSIDDFCRQLGIDPTTAVASVLHPLGDTTSATAINTLLNRAAAVAAAAAAAAAPVSSQANAPMGGGSVRCATSLRRVLDRDGVLDRVWDMLTRASGAAGTTGAADAVKTAVHNNWRRLLEIADDEE